MGAAKNYCIFAALHSAGTMAMVTILGAMVMLGTIFDFRILLLWVLGLLINLAGFSHNDLVDVETDKLSLKERSKPLAEGKISMRGAKIFVAVTLVAWYVFGLFMAWPNLVGFLFMTLSFVTGTIYNVYGKRVWYAGLSISLFVFFLVLYSASVIGTPSIISFLVAAFFGLEMVVMCTEIYAIKDLRSDPVNVASALGCKICGDRLFISFKFKLYSWSLKLCQALIVIAFIFLLRLSWIYILIASALLVVDIYTHCWHLNLKRLHRDDYNKKTKLQCAAAFVLIGVLLTAVVPPLEILLVVGVTLIWLVAFNYILYSGPMKVKC